MVQTVAELCTIEVIPEIFVKVKSTPLTVESVEQSISSLPVTVKVIDVEVAVGPARARVTVGADVSTRIALFAPSDPVADGAANVSVDAFPAKSKIVPPLSASELVAT
jgi:hypothetical protein